MFYVSHTLTPSKTATLLILQDCISVNSLPISSAEIDREILEMSGNLQSLQLIRPTLSICKTCSIAIEYVLILRAKASLGSNTMQFGKPSKVQTHEPTPTYQLCFILQF
jgi:hypothetical protein